MLIQTQYDTHDSTPTHPKSTLHTSSVMKASSSSQSSGSHFAYGGTSGTPIQDTGTLNGQSILPLGPPDEYRNVDNTNFSAYSSDLGPSDEYRNVNNTNFSAHSSGIPKYQNVTFEGKNEDTTSTQRSESTNSGLSDYIYSIPATAPIPHAGVRYPALAANGVLHGGNSSNLKKVTKRSTKTKNYDAPEDEESDTSIEHAYGVLVPPDRGRSPTARPRFASPLVREGSSTAYSSTPLGREGSTANSSTGKTSNSGGYTKSLESELEDFIQDLLFVGNGKQCKPGRRQMERAPPVRNQTDKTKPEEKTFASCEDEEGWNSAQDDSMAETKDETFLDSLDYIEYNLKNLFGAFFPLGEDVDASSMTKDSIDSYSTSSTSLQKESKALSFNGFVELCLDAKAIFGANCDASAYGLDPPRKHKGRRGNRSGSSTTRSAASYLTSKGYTENTPAPPLENDLRLTVLAFEAARSLHKINGYVFDKDYEIDIVSDVKFSVVRLELPLGIIFEENDWGCWVTEIKPGGNAGATKRVNPGDQLAAINRISAIHVKLDELVKKIKESESNQIELTFLRYVGPLRPAPGTVEVKRVKPSPPSTLNAPNKNDKLTDVSARSEPKANTNSDQKRNDENVTNAAARNRVSNGREKTQKAPDMEDNVKGKKKKFRMFRRKQ